ncbi:MULTISPECIES: serine hydrolase [unclassified Janthinobacterium]|uniref:serine hydrolase domain-containing protein n=1 Tax=unclassified Janthinobacterium TaxID=2610881 RepID=UPI0017A4953E|nr:MULTISPECIES: serine hydrolase domain-containing protein [unclassified Janthinobacterium]MBB5606346.1 CubicO group peptidase (beta-lactamase class C family) [Janthinobacterium sp. S3T4]MBB5611782.1 CubicO group peptidase (beta-lactamase class C family) [Janthinobacterium sp. S3M3]
MILRPFFRVVLPLALLTPPAAYAAEPLAQAVSQQMHLNAQRYGIAGQAVFIAHDGKLLFRGADGDANLATREHITADTLFPVYSLSKLFASTLLMQLVEQGRIELDKPASLYVHGLPAAWHHITVRQFLNHTSGVPEYFGAAQTRDDGPRAPFPASLQAALDGLAEQPLQFAAGSNTRYTQTNYLVLSALLEAHYGKPYERIADERILQKLGLKHTYLGAAALPKAGVATSYMGKDGALQQSKEVAWPAYAHGHSDLYISLDDLSRFLQALADGKLVGKTALQQFWQTPVLANGQRGGFATGWETGEMGPYHEVGHDGGTKVRARILYQTSLDHPYTFIYLTNGSARNVWSRTLVNSVMAAAAPDQFPAEVVSERLIHAALAPAFDSAAQAKSLQMQGTVQGAALERTVNSTGYMLRENLRLDAAIRVFELNTVLFPASANVWDSLAETYQAKGDQAKAKLLYEKSRQLLPHGLK